MWKTDPYNYSRRPSDEIQIGKLKMGGNNPIRVQSMANTNTNDIENSIDQVIRIVKEGADLVRLTTQGLKEVDSIKIIHDKIREKGYETPIVADIHFNANVADYAAQFIEKVRVNPGNYVSGIRTAVRHEYTDEEYHEEFLKIKERFTKLINVCKEHNTAIRIGVNHGSLSGRMLYKWGNTAEGMVASCLEFLQICKEENFNHLVISMKASNTVQMIQAVRLLVEKMEEQDFHFPIHLGVTEAGDGEDGRIKSAVGTGGLIAEGIGDTVRVSLSEDPEKEVPVGKIMRDYITARSQNTKKISIKSTKPFTIEPFKQRSTYSIRNIGGENLPIVIAQKCDHPNLKPDYLIENDIITNSKEEKFPIYNFGNAPLEAGEELIFIKTSYDELSDEILDILRKNSNIVILLEVNPENPVGEYRAFIHTLIAEGIKTPVILVGNYSENDLESLQIKSAADLGIIFVDGLANGILLQNSDSITAEKLLSVSYGILQATRVRISKTEYISCPSCGRTNFHLQDVIAKVKAKTSHLTGLKIGIMGCIVNGPGEMADADYGYVGAGIGTVMLYKKHECIERGIPEDDAVNRLIELIKKHGDWKEPIF